MSVINLKNVEGFTPVPDSIREKYGVITASVFGVIWRFSRTQDGICKQSYKTLGQYIGLNRVTITRHVKILEEAGLITKLEKNGRKNNHIIIGVKNG